MKKYSHLIWFFVGVLTDVLNAVLLTFLCFVHPFFLNKVIPLMIIVPLILAFLFRKMNKPVAAGFLAGLIPVLVFIFHAFSTAYVIQ